METRKPLSPDKKRYATYLRPESIKAVRRYAFERDQSDYQIVQEAIDEYLQRTTKQEQQPAQQARIEWT
jgi:hypothetical protein